MVFTADYLRNIETHTLLAIDTNHVGDARFFNMTNAVAAINTTLANCGVSGANAINLAIANCPNNPVTGAPGYNQGATIADFATNGLDSGYSLCSGAPCSHRCVSRHQSRPGHQPDAVPQRPLRLQRPANVSESKTSASPSREFPISTSRFRTRTRNMWPRRWTMTSSTLPRTSILPCITSAPTDSTAAINSPLAAPWTCPTHSGLA